MASTKAEIEERLAEVRAAISKALKAQSYDSGAESITRPSLQRLLEEERLLEARLARINSGYRTRLKVRLA